MSICIFYENLYTKSQVSLNAIVIIQILSNTPYANWEMLKNENCMCSSKDYIELQEFLSHKSFAQCFT